MKDQLAWSNIVLLLLFYVYKKHTLTGALTMTGGICVFAIRVGAVA